MYKKTIKSAPMGNLPLFFNDNLNFDNRWVVLSELIPWDAVENIYMLNFASDSGAQALPSRVAFGSIFIQIKLNLTDEETVDAISENPYLQYFIGFEAFKLSAPFDSSLMTHFRKRFAFGDIKDIDDLIHKVTQASSIKNSDDDIAPTHSGQLVIDATCSPADIHYPTDLGLLNKAREKTEEIIDVLWQTRRNKSSKIKPRSYRKKGRKVFLAIIKQKRPGKKKIRKAIGVQLTLVKNNLKSIEKLNYFSFLSDLPKRLYKDLLVIDQLYQQQEYLYIERKTSVPNRIVSIGQPHIRPIVRGKAGANVEFGAKISISVVNGWIFVDTISFDAYNESGELIEQVKRYKIRFGYYPISVHADQIYRNRENRKFCKDNGIRLSGPKLGRPSSKQEIFKEQKVQEYKDQGVRNIVESKFGVAKRRYGLDIIMTKLSTTSKTVIALIFMVINLDNLIFLFAYIYRPIFKKNTNIKIISLRYFPIKQFFQQYKIPTTGYLTC